VRTKLAYLVPPSGARLTVCALQAIHGTQVSAWPWCCRAGRRIEVQPDFDTSTFERLVGILERA